MIMHIRLLLFYCPFTGCVYLYIDLFWSVVISGVHFVTELLSRVKTIIGGLFWTLGVTYY